MVWETQVSLSSVFLCTMTLIPGDTQGVRLILKMAMDWISHVVVGIYEDSQRKSEYDFPD